MYETRKYKIELRKKYLEKRTAIPAEVRAARDAKICRNILSSAAYRYADVILMFYPMKAEVDIFPVMEAALATGKRVAFPRCNAEDHTMIFYFVNSMEDFEKGAYGINEPKTTLDAFDPDSMETQNVLCLVPAIVYDRRGFRVGYGGGYYDRFFGKTRPASIGVVYEEFILKSVPHGRYDITVDVVVSERGIYACK
jgi:5-formyltetrahydrofolate cyclo-ligase